MVNALGIELAPHCICAVVVPPIKVTGVEAPFPVTVPVVTVQALLAPVFPAQVCTPHLLSKRWVSVFQSAASETINGFSLKRRSSNSLIE